MDPVSHLSRIVALLRRQANDAASRISGRERPGHASRTDGAATQRPAVEQLERQIGEKIRDLDPAARDHKQRATRIFVESVLAWEFGDRIVNDPRFPALVGHVQAAMESNSATSSAIQAMLDEMRA